jgi:hypothetical protein
MNAIIAKLISLYKQRSYSQRLEMLQIDHTREVTGSSPVSPSGGNRAQSYTQYTHVHRYSAYFVNNYRTTTYGSYAYANL